MTTSASDALVTKSESVPVSDETHVTPATSAGSVGGDGGAHPTASVAGADSAGALQEAGSHGAPSDGHQPLAPDDATVTKEEMERYMKISRDLKMRRGSLMPPSGTLQSGKNISASPSGVHCPGPTGGGLGVKKKASLTMETRVELYGKGRIKLNFDALSEDCSQGAGNAAGTSGGVVYQNIYPDDSTTSLVKRGGPSTAITPRRLSMEDKLAPPPPTPAPSAVSIKLPSTFPGKDDE